MFGVVMLHAATPPLPVLHESSRVLVVDKPAGVPFHATADSLGVLQLLRASGDAQAHRLWPVHRLDRVTSGVLVFAKTREDAGLLSAAFRHGAVAKFYVALSARRPAKKMGTVAGDMAPSRRGAHKLQRTQERPATTRFVSSGVVGGARPLRGFVLRPLTGRTHQLRVAMKALGAPVLGDSLYAAAADARPEERAYLHAAAIRLPPLSADDAPVSVVCAPSSGTEFTSEAFAAWFAARFPPSLVDDTHACWFPDDALLRTPPPSESDEWRSRLDGGSGNDDWQDVDEAGTT